jgi:hypothetical protein
MAKKCRAKRSPVVCEYQSTIFLPPDFFAESAAPELGCYQREGELRFRTDEIFARQEENHCKQYEDNVHESTLSDWRVAPGGLSKCKPRKTLVPGHLTTDH